MNASLHNKDNLEVTKEADSGAKSGRGKTPATWFGLSEASTGQVSVLFGHTIVRQFRFPPLLRGLAEAMIFASVYLMAGVISLGISIDAMMAPMVPIVLLMMFCMVASGVYRDEITHSILNLYIHSIYGFFLASIGFVFMTLFLPEPYSQPKFIFFFLFFG